MKRNWHSSKRSYSHPHQQQARFSLADWCSQVWLQDVTLDSSEGPMSPLVSVDGGSFYSAVPVPVQMDGGAAGSVAGPVPPEDVLFLSASDPWIVSAAAVRASVLSI